jgi:cytochrome c-type biogenesis protein CcmH/NrfF
MDGFRRKITGFHRDQRQDWVAELECGHTQHVRHNPPWMNRSWVTSEEGRFAHLGAVLRCKKCQEQEAASR